MDEIEQPRPKGWTAMFKKVGETAFYRRTMAYRPAFLRGALGIAIAVLVWDRDNPGDIKGSILQGLVAWRLFIDSSMGQAREDAKKVTPLDHAKILG
jgi:hypothetical protein